MVLCVCESFVHGLDRLRCKQVQRGVTGGQDIHESRRSADGKLLLFCRVAAASSQRGQLNWHTGNRRDDVVFAYRTLVAQTEDVVQI
jgi:hypothetical protein